jgi:hypothetical protein
MLRKGLLLGLLLASLCVAVSPALAYVELVVAPSGYVFSPTADPPEITVQPSDQFFLEISIWTDESGVSTGGLNAYIYYLPSLVKAKDTGGNIVDYPQPVVDDSGCQIPWQSMMPKNQGDNIVGKISYEQQTGLMPVTLQVGKTLIGLVEFHCEGCGDVEIYPGDDSSLMPGPMPGNLFTSYHGTIVHQVPEPATLVLLGSGLVLGGFAYRRRRG